MPVAVLNIGGVANVTYIDGSDLIACDTGPGNALLDDFLRVRTGQLLDTDGRIAAAGKPDENAIAQFLAHSYFSKPPPKSLDRNEFRRAAGAVLNNSSGSKPGGNIDRANRGRRRPCCAAFAAAAKDVDRFRWRGAQSDTDAHARRAIGASAGRKRA